MSDDITPAEAAWVCAVLEMYTNRQEVAADEELRQSVWGKLRAIARAKPEPRPKRVVLTESMRRMLRSLRDHDNPLHHCRTQADYGGADGTMRALVRRGLAEWTRGDRLKITDAGRAAILEIREASLRVLRALRAPRCASVLLAWPAEDQRAYVSLSRAGYVERWSPWRYSRKASAPFEWDGIRATEAGLEYLRQIEG